LPEIDQFFWMESLSVMWNSDDYPHVNRWMEAMKNYLGPVYDENTANAIKINQKWKTLVEQKQAQESGVVLHYFGAKARPFGAQVAAAHLGKSSDEFKWEKYSMDDWGNNKNGIKSHCNFGQLPVLRDGDMWMTQTMGIVRYLGKKWNLEGSNMKDYSMSEMLIAESQDLMALLYQAKYNKGNTRQAWEEILSKICKHYVKIEKLMTGDKFGSELLMGDFCLFHILNIVMDSDPKSLDNHSNLKSWYDGIASNDGVKALLESAFITLKMPDA